MTVPEVVSKVMDASGFSELNPVQRAALDAGLLDGKNMVVAAATASGKTLIAEIAMMDAVSKGKKALYIVPLKALATEKHAEFKEKYGRMGIRVAVSIGDRDSAEPWLSGFDVIIATSEKLDSLIRHGAEWLPAVGLVVADEIHLIDSPNRGPTLEVILTRLMRLINPQVLALSATINNYRDLAEWLDAVPVKSDYRPVKLYSGVFHGNEVSWHPQKPKLTLPADLPPVFEITKDTMKRKKQSLVFVSTRRNAESLAEKLGDVLRPLMSPEERKDLVKLSYEVSHVLDHPTKQCQRLGGCIQKGAVFHHAGLVARQRSMIEDAFRSGLIKVICATPTLAAGVNLPAYRVVVRDLKRFESFRGMDYIPVLEAQQMMGRAGRPKYDTEGEAILIAGTEEEAKRFWEQYVMGDSEDIVSKLGVEPVLRMHVLSLIATTWGTTRGSLMDFFGRTFYAHQYRDMTALERELDKVLGMLQKSGFIETGGDGKKNFGEFVQASSLGSDDGAIKPTKIGKRVAELYIDPLTADHMIKCIEEMDVQKKMSELSVLHSISGCLEMKPGLGVRKRDMENEKKDTLPAFLARFSAHLVGRIPTEWEMDYEDFLRGIKLSWMLSEWMEESGEDDLMEDFGVTPGELRARIDISDWLFYSMQEIALLLDKRGVITAIRKARLRVKYGIKSELLPLVKLRNVGRVRARMLFNRGHKTLESLRQAPVTALSQIVGPGIAKDMKKQLSGPVSAGEHDGQESLAGSGREQY